MILKIEMHLTLIAIVNNAESLVILTKMLSASAVMHLIIIGVRKKTYRKKDIKFFVSRK